MKTLGMTKEQFAEKAYDLAYHKEATLGCCPQAVLGAFQELLAMKDTLTLKAAGAFGGGIAHQYLTCGALLAGIMVISMKYGRGENNMEDYEASVKSMELANKLMLRFKHEFGTLDCRDISGMKAGSLEEVIEWFESGRHDKECPVVCGKTARMVAEVLYEREEELLFNPSKIRKFWIKL